MSKIQICLATNNQHKIVELQQMLSDTFEVKTLNEIGCFEEIEETGTTFEENSKIKADYIFNKYGLNIIADDSGLEVEALNNEPGVFSARYGGLPTNHEKNISTLLLNLGDSKNRNARFRTVITLIFEGSTYFFEGEINGSILNKKRGNEGFGYDPIFVPEGFNETFAEMDSIQKNKISHRGIAIQKMIAFLKTKKENNE
jgi:XTP/dITP diphosphohydrolase